MDDETTVNVEQTTQNNDVTGSTNSVDESQLIGQATPEQIATWKAQYGNVFQITVGGSVCYVKKPTRATVSHMATLASNMIRANELLLNDTWLGGDETIKTDDEKFLGVSAQLAGILEIKEAELKKL